VRRVTDSCRGLGKVFSRPAYVVGAIVSALVLLYIVNLVPNWALAKLVWASGIGVEDKIVFSLRFFLSLFSNFAPFALSYTIALALLFGINVSASVYYVKYYRSKLSSGATAGSTLGLLAGIIGVGCASCGALLIAPLLGTAAVGVIATAFPLAGGEFAIIGIVILLWSLYVLGKKIDNPYE